MPCQSNKNLDIKKNTSKVIKADGIAEFTKWFGHLTNWHFKNATIAPISIIDINPHLLNRCKFDQKNQLIIKLPHSKKTSKSGIK